MEGCGRGYDVVLLALHGFDAYGLDASSTAVAMAQDYASSEMKNPSSMYFSMLSDEEIAAYRQKRGDARFFEANFFEDDWAGRDAPRWFDLVYDYTVSCYVYES